MKSIFEVDSLDKFLKKNKEQPFRKKQLYNNIFRNHNISFEKMTDISKDLRNKLSKEFFVLSIEATNILEDKETSKINFQTQDGKFFETVLMFHYSKHHKWKLNRITICLSSQIGCAVWCKFCVTGKLWLFRDLKYNEIVEQIIWSNKYIANKFGQKEDRTYHKIRNVVFMGMGEPLLNYDNVAKSINFMIWQKFLSLSRRHITISTSGIIPGIQKLIDDNIEVMLAISLHAWTQTTRQSIMPISKTYNIDKLIDILDKYIKTTNNRIFYEYIMIKNITDTETEAKALIKLLRWQLAHVNLIAYNENPTVNFKRSSNNRIHKFKKILEESNITVTIRESLWNELKWACGQLGYEKIQKNS